MKMDFANNNLTEVDLTDVDLTEVDLTEVDLTEVDLTEHLLRDIQFYYTPILVCLGSLGNCLSVCVFFGTKLYRSSSSVYLGALAISDTGFLISVFVVWLNMVGVGLFNQAGFCQFFIYLTTLCSFMSVWFVVAFTVERFIAVLYPLHCQSLCTLRRAKYIVAALTGLGALLCSPVLWLSAPRIQMKLKENVTECHLAEGWESSATVFNVIDTIVTFAIPFSLIFVLNILIIRGVYKHARTRKNLTTDINTGSERSSCPQTPRSGLVQTKITKMLLVVSTVSLCFNLPAYVVRIHAFLYFQEDNNASRIAELAQQVCNLLFNTNFGINFILYCITAQNFREAMCRMFVQKRRKRNQTVTQVSNHVLEHVQLNELTGNQSAAVVTESREECYELQDTKS